MLQKQQVLNFLLLHTTLGAHALTTA